MLAAPPENPNDPGLKLRLGLAGGTLAFSAALVAGLLVEWIHLDLTFLHAMLLLGLALVAGAAGTIVGRRAGASIADPLEALARSLDAAPDATPSPLLQVDAPGELGKAARSVAAMSRAFVLARDDLAAAAARISAESSAIHQAASRRSAQSQTEAASINQTNGTALEIARSTLQTLAQADSVIEMAQRSEELSADGARVVAGAVRASGTLAEHVRRVTTMVSELSERTSQIAEIVVTVQDLAEQTDLVALNASVEAAKAGEQGRGFAVVAMEMRQLAEQSRQAATQVRAILGEIDRGVQVSASATEEGAARAQEAQQLARSAGEALEGLMLVIRNSASAARQIAEASRRQTSDVQSMVSSFGDLARTLNSGANDAQDLERSSKVLTDLSRALAERASGPAVTPVPGTPA